MVRQIAGQGISRIDHGFLRDPRTLIRRSTFRYSTLRPGRAGLSRCAAASTLLKSAGGFVPCCIPARSTDTDSQSQPSSNSPVPRRRRLQLLAENPLLDMLIGSSRQLGQSIPCQSTVHRRRRPLSCTPAAIRPSCRLNANTSQPPNVSRLAVCLSWFLASANTRFPCCLRCTARPRCNS